MTKIKGPPTFIHRPTNLGIWIKVNMAKRSGKNRLWINVRPIDGAPKQWRSSKALVYAFGVDVECTQDAPLPSKQNATGSSRARRRRGSA